MSYPQESKPNPAKDPFNTSDQADWRIGTADVIGLYLPLATLRSRMVPPVESRPKPRATKAREQPNWTLLGDN